MNREGIRRLAAEELGLPTSAYRFADTLESFRAACDDIGYPNFVKPVMSSSGKGQSRVKEFSEVDAAWKYAQTGGRVNQGTVIVESQIDFDFEITLLTVRSKTQKQVKLKLRTATQLVTAKTRATMLKAGSLKPCRQWPSTKQSVLPIKSPSHWVAVVFSV